METIAVIDFESTGEPTSRGGRATEVAIALLRDGRVVDRHQSLMNAGAWINSFAAELTGITNAMIAKAPPADRVMREAARFVGGLPMVAHNAAFDSGLWRAELGRLGLDAPNVFACTMLLSRRVFPGAPDHKLGTLSRMLGIPPGRSHRAMDDAEACAGVLWRIQREMRARHGLAGLPGHDLLARVQKVPKNKFAERMAQEAAGLLDLR